MLVPPPLLQLDRVITGYGQVPVLHGVSLAVGAAEIVCLLGANGAGKSTTLLAILGLLRLNGGAITFDGGNLGTDTAGIIRRGIAIVPEGRRIFGPLSVEENLRIGAEVRRSNGADRARDLERVFTLFPILKHKRAHSGGALSGGQQQMLAIGRALMTRPRLLLLDEPTMGLSPLLAEQVVDTLATIRAEGVAVLIVEQNAFAVLDTATRGYVLQAGEIVLEGSAASLRCNDLVREAYL